MAPGSPRVPRAGVSVAGEVEMSLISQFVLLSYQNTRVLDTRLKLGTNLAFS